MPDPVLIILHQEHSTPGRVGQALKSRGFVLDIRRPRLGDALPAEGEVFPVQAFRYGPCAYAIQFHPEVTHAMMCRWTTRGHERLALPGAKPRVAHFEDRAVHDFSIRAWLTSFLDHWTSQDLPDRVEAAE